jgi:hypothetical protein
LDVEGSKGDRVRERRLMSQKGESEMNFLFRQQWDG